jgi:hypothetical protein
MDGQSLQNMWESGSPFLAQMGEQAWGQDKQKAQQALLAAQGQEQRAQAMQPLEMAHKQVTTGYNQALTQQLTDKKAGELPPDKRLEMAVQEWSGKMSEGQRAQENGKMQQRLQWAEMAKANNGVMPLEYMNSIPQEERKYFATPKDVEQTLKFGNAWYNAQGSVKEARAKEAAALARAKEAAGPGYARAASGGGKATGKPPGSPSALMTHYTMKANEEVEGSPEWTKYMTLAQNEWQKLQALKTQAAEAGLTGKMDIPATVQSGIPQVRGAPVPSAMPGTKPQQWTPPAGWK